MDNEDEGARLTRREETRELIAKHRATVEPRGCPTPGACSCPIPDVDAGTQLVRLTVELADLKQRLLPQYKGRAERAEHERDGMLEELIAARKTINQIKLEWEPAPSSATAATDRPDWARQLPGAELYDRAARYEYIRKLNLREFAALYDAAMRGERFDDVVDRYRDAKEPSK